MQSIQFTWSEAMTIAEPSTNSLSLYKKHYCFELAKYINTSLRYKV